MRVDLGQELARRFDIVWFASLKKEKSKRPVDLSGITCELVGSLKVRNGQLILVYREELRGLEYGREEGGLKAIAAWATPSFPSGSGRSLLDAK